MAGVIVYAVVKVMRALAIDDVVDAVAVHLGCGTWSAITAPIFSKIKSKDKQSCSIAKVC